MRALGAHSALSRHVGLHHHLRADRARPAVRMEPHPYPLMVLAGKQGSGKFAADATQLPTGCQPESLAKPTRRRPHKRVYRRPKKKPRSGRGRDLEFRGSNSTKRVSVVRPFYGAFLVGRLTLTSASMLWHTASRWRSP